MWRGRQGRSRQGARTTGIRSYKHASILYETNHHLLLHSIKILMYIVLHPKSSETGNLFSKDWRKLPHFSKQHHHWMRQRNAVLRATLAWAAAPYRLPESVGSHWGWPSEGPVPAMKSVGYSFRGVNWFITTMENGKCHLYRLDLTPQWEFSNNKICLIWRECMQEIICLVFFGSFPTTNLEVQSLRIQKTRRLQASWGHQAEWSNAKTVPSVTIEIATDTGPFGSIYLLKLDNFQN